MGIAKTVVTEITHSKRQEIKAFGIINGVWGLGKLLITCIYICYRC